MKMKKTLAFIMTAALAVGTLAGCSQATLNYSKELSNVAKWEASTSNIEGTVNVDISGIKEQINISATGYKAKDQSYVDMKFTDPSGKFNIPELKAYTDGTTAYINKSFYQGIATLTGQAAPAGLANVKEEFIGIDMGTTGTTANPMGTYVAKIQELTTKEDGMIELGKIIFGENSDVDIPFVQNGREYTINLDADKTVDLASKAVKAAGNNIENINNTFKFGLPAESITQIKAAVNDAKFDTQFAAAKTMLAGTTIDSKEVFTDNGYSADFNMNLKIKDLGAISLVMKATTTKSETKAITFPTSTLKVTQEEFNKLLAPTNTTIASTTNVVAK